MRPSKRLAALSVASVLCLVGQAVAQSQPQLPPPPTAPVSGGADPSLSAPYPVEPVTDGSNISLQGVGSSLDKLSEDADAGLGKMSGDASAKSGGGLKSEPLLGEQAVVKLPEMGISTDIETVAKSRELQKDILILRKLNEKADLSIDLWEKVFNNENALAARLAKQKADEDAKREAQKTPAAVAAALPPVQPVVVEVLGGEAMILVPGSGLVNVGRGATLANGMRITAIDVDGVRATDRSGRPVLLGFGTSLAGGPTPATN